MDQILLRIRVRLFRIVEGISGGTEVVGDTGEDEVKLDRIKILSRTEIMEIEAERYTKGHTNDIKVFTKNQTAHIKIIPFGS